MTCRHSETQHGLNPLPPPRLATPGYEPVGYWLLRARAAPGTAVEYNKALGALWARCTSSRTLPSPKQFDQALTAVRKKLDAAYTKAGTAEARRDLERATDALNRVEHEAVELDLLS